MRVLIFGGTTEGRKLSAALSKNGINVTLSVATEFGRDVAASDRVAVISNRLDEESMIALLRQGAFDYVMDATHPYAVLASKNIRSACHAAGLTFLQLKRPESAVTPGVIYVQDADTAAEMLKRNDERVLLTIGSKELEPFTHIENYTARFSVRLLPMQDSLKKALDLGFRASNIICMQGPFDKEMNTATLKMTGAKFLVTKESGDIGGFEEKVSAALSLGCEVLVIARPEAGPVQEKTFTFNELLDIFKIKEIQEKPPKQAMEKLFVIGFGPGDDSLLTDKAKDTLNTVQRILSTVRISGADGRIQGMTLPELMLKLKDPEKGGTAVLVSGDCGFFSAARTIIRDFSGLYEIELIPGIGSIQYLSAKIKITYDDAALISLHGRTGNIVAKVAYNKKVFALTGGANSVRDICRILCRYGLGNVSVSVGEKLSYPDERILNGRADELKDTDFDKLSVMYIENLSAADPHIPLTDGDFIRGDVPMTKEEIRWLSIQKLGISHQDIVFDIGAGTGSVSVEMARKAFSGFVYAIEAKEDACALVRENITKHGAFNIEIIQGEAPEALEGLPTPDKVFIGGSSGNMLSILKKLTFLNPNITIVANVVTIQTMNQIIDGFEKNKISNTEIICVNVAKSRKSGSYDMMMAQNPVYIIKGLGTGHV